MTKQNTGEPTHAVIFDNDGVLVDSEPLHRIAWEQTFGPRGVVVPDEDYAWSIGRRDLTFAGRMAEKFGIADAAEVIRDEKHDHLRRLLTEQSETFPGAADLVRALAPDHRLGISSSAMRAEVAIVLDRFGLEGLFDVIVANEDVTKHKPDPEPYLLCAERLGIPPERCIVFEDSLTGIDAARSAGMRVIAFTSTFPAAELARADAVVENLADTDALLGLIRSLES